jgi:hypothetical protein
MSRTTEEVAICNQALARLGALRFTFADQTTKEGVYCELFYEQTRDALLRSFVWNFASARKTLAQETETPDFEWDYQYKLPENYLRMKGEYGEDDFIIEGGLLLTNDDDVDIRYVKKVTDTAEFDSLFIEVLILELAKKLLPPLVGTKNPHLVEEINRDLLKARAKASAVCRSENKQRDAEDTWNMARHSNGLV